MDKSEDKSSFVDSCFRRNDNAGKKDRISSPDLQGQ